MLRRQHAARARRDNPSGTMLAAKRKTKRDALTMIDASEEVGAAD
jgi:hypothetical protein